ncbi:MAG: sugar phosphate nucleotidyltransferase [Minicystis sp.]
MVILAGGLGTRMLPRTATMPKFLLPVAGKPFACWQLARLAAAGFDEALICVAHLGEEIRREVGHGARFGLRVRYADEGETLLGTAGALRRALAALQSTFLVTYGDSYLPFDYLGPLRDLRAHPEARGTMAVWKNEGRFDRSNTVVRGEIVARYRKQARDEAVDPAFDHIDYGATALRREVIEALPASAPCGLDSVQRALADAGTLRAFPAPRRFFEIGSEAGLHDLEIELGQAALDQGAAR